MFSVESIAKFDAGQSLSADATAEVRDSTVGYAFRRDFWEESLREVEDKYMESVVGSSCVIIWKVNPSNPKLKGDIQGRYEYTEPEVPYEVFDAINNKGKHAGTDKDGRKWSYCKDKKGWKYRTFLPNPYTSAKAVFGKCLELGIDPSQMSKDEASKAIKAKQSEDAGEGETSSAHSAFTKCLKAVDTITAQWQALTDDGRESIWARIRKYEV